MVRAALLSALRWVAVLAFFAVACATDPAAPVEEGLVRDDAFHSGRFALTSVNGGGLPFVRAQPSTWGLAVRITGGYFELFEGPPEVRIAVTTHFPCRGGSTVQEDRAQGTFVLDGDSIRITLDPPSALAVESAVWITAQRRSIRAKLRHLDGLQTMTFQLR